MRNNSLRFVFTIKKNILKCILSSKNLPPSISILYRASLPLCALPIAASAAFPVALTAAASAALPAAASAAFPVAFPAAFPAAASAAAFTVIVRTYLHITSE